MGVVIDGKILLRKVTGVERYARETLKCLDCIIKPGEYSIAVPSSCDIKNLPHYNNLKYVIVPGFKSGALWEQISLTKYIIKNKLILVNFDYATTLFKPGISTFHDMSFKANPQFFRNKIKQRLIALKLSVYCTVIAQSAQPIVTVSKFQQNEIIKYYKIDPNRIIIAGNAWQHFDEIRVDESVIMEYSLQKGEYFFSLSSNTPNKNFKWIYENAKRFPENKYVIVGGSTSITAEELKNVDNIIYLGYQSDERVKALYKNCKAFVFPSYYEGFGIPPMEALSVGAKIVVSNIPSMKEIFEDSAYYLDPNDCSVNLNDIIQNKCNNGMYVLERYSWIKTAEIWKGLIDRYK